MDEWDACWKASFACFHVSAGRVRSEHSGLEGGNDAWRFAHTNSHWSLSLTD